MKKINILYIEDVAEIAGGPNSLLQLFGQIYNDVNIHIFAPEGAFTSQAKLFSNNINITNITRYESIVLFGKRFPNFYHIFLRLLDSVKIFKYIKKHNIDIVHSNDLDGHIIAWFLNHIFRVKSIWHIRIMTWPKILYQIKRVSQIIFVSKAVMNFSIKDSNKKNATVIYNGIDIDNFRKKLNSFNAIDTKRKLNINDEDFVVGYVARVKHQKRQKIVVKSIANLIQKGYRIKVVFVGDDSVTKESISGRGENYYNELKQMVKKMKIEKHCIFVGHQKNTAKFYNIFDCFIFPAINDSNPRVILEAMASKIPIVANNTGGVVDMLENGKFGLISQVDNVDDFSNNIEKIINNKSSINTEETFFKLNKDFKIEIHKDNILDLYQRILYKKDQF